MEKSYQKNEEENQKGDRRSLILFKRTFFFLKGDIYENKIQRKTPKRYHKTTFWKAGEGYFSKQEDITTKGVLHKAWLFSFAKNLWKRMFFQSFLSGKEDFPRSSRNSDFSHGDWAGCFGALQRQSQLASVCTLSACVVWSCMRHCPAQELKRLPKARRASACASATQWCFGATRRWWCDLSHVGPWRTLAPSSIATVFSNNILAMILSQKEQSSFRLPGCHHLAKASNCWGRRGVSGGGQQQRTWAGVLSLQPHVEVWHVQRQHAQRSGSRTWSSSHRSGRGEVETFQFDRGGSDAARRGGVDVERATCPATWMFVLCWDVLSPCAIIPGLSWLQRTRPGVLPCRPRALREAARLNRVRITSAHWQWRPSWWIATPSCGGLACPTPSCTPQWRFWQHSSRQCSIPGWAWAFGSSPVLLRRCCWTCLFSARKPSRCGQRRAKGFFVTFVSVSANAIDAISAVVFFFGKIIILSEILNTNHFLCFQGKQLFSYGSKIALRYWELSWSLPHAVTLLSEWSLCTISCHWSRPRDNRCIKLSLSLFFSALKKKKTRGTRFLRNIERRMICRKVVLEKTTKNRYLKSVQKEIWKQLVFQEKERMFEQNSQQ